MDKTIGRVIDVGFSDDKQTIAPIVVALAVVVMPDELKQRQDIMNLGTLIETLKTKDPDKVVLNGFGEGMSWRGSYDEAAFEPVERTTYGEMLKHAEALLNSVQTGYKGGEYTARIRR